MKVFSESLGIDIPLNADYFSPFVPLKTIVLYSIAAILTGNPTGTIKLQASNDFETDTTIPLPDPINWVDITNSPFPITDEGETLWNVRDIGYNYVRLVYLDASGGTSTATMSVIFTGKSV